MFVGPEKHDYKLLIPSVPGNYLRIVHFLRCTSAV